MQEKFSIQYGIGSVNGTYVKDTVMVAGAKVPQQQFGLATYTKDILIPQDSNSGGGGSASTVNANGILGLGYPQLTAATTQNNPAYTPFVFNLVQQGVIQEPVFSVYLNSASKQGWAGEIIFGGVDHSKYEGDLQYLPVAKLQSQPSPAPEGEGNGGSGSIPGNDGSGNDGSGNGGSGTGGSGTGGSGNDGSGSDGSGSDGSGSDGSGTGGSGTGGSGTGGSGNDGSGNGYGGYMDGGNPQKNNGSSLAQTQLLQIINFDNHNDLNPPLYQSDTGNTTSPNYNGYYYWMVYGQGIAVRNGVQSPEFKLQKPGAFILDTGSTLTYLPNDVAISIATAMAGSNGFQLDRQSGLLVVDCSTANSQATIELQMSTTSSLNSPPVTLSVKASELVIPLDGETAQSARTCLFGIAPVGGSGALGPNMFLIGDSMLRSAYLVFDMGQNRVGIAAAKGMGGMVNGTGTASSGGGSSSDTSGAQSMHKISIGSLWFGQLCLVLLFTANLSPFILI
ncbi:aspartic peptidase domain-containing protein [Absidia repens]|uniref:Aspartic peptidase domain-containing protein n=1 Tax=Absidia repens TaxID=90262 RepID=A0A1X2J185_9FUNG|nr:aspartic peptidase domain-containing protein [Absidia repens]